MAQIKPKVYFEVQCKIERKIVSNLSLPCLSRSKQQQQQQRRRQRPQITSISLILFKKTLICFFEQNHIFHFNFVLRWCTLWIRASQPGVRKVHEGNEIVYFLLFLKPCLWI